MRPEGLSQRQLLCYILILQECDYGAIITYYFHLDKLLSSSEEGGNQQL
jgi:hypothetical protein